MAEWVTSREVTPKIADPWHAAYRCRIDVADPSLFRRLPRWRVVMESYFVHWSDFARSAKFSSVEAAEAHANWWLDQKEQGGLVHYVANPKESP